MVGWGTGTGRVGRCAYGIVRTEGLRAVCGMGVVTSGSDALDVVGGLDVGQSRVVWFDCRARHDHGGSLMRKGICQPPPFCTLKSCKSGDG